MVRLGQGVDATGRLADEALARTFAAIDEYAALIAAHDVDRVRFCATSASRDAENSAVFVAGVRARLGVEPEVVSGDEEAALSFDGAVRNLRHTPAEPVLVVDIGGGSTELVLGTTAGGPDAAVSLDIGSVRLHERHLRSDPPTADEVADCVAAIDSQLDGSPVPLAEAATVVGVAGTVTSVGAGVLDLAAYDRSLVDQAVVAVADVHALVDRLLGDEPCGAAGAALAAPGPGGRHRCRVADPVPRAAAYGSDGPGRLRGGHPGRDRLVVGLIGGPIG